MVIREIFSSLHVKEIRERGCGFAVVDVVAVVSFFARVLFCLHVVAFSQVKLLGVQNGNASMHSVQNLEISHLSEHTRL